MCRLRMLYAEAAAKHQDEISMTLASEEGLTITPISDLKKEHADAHALAAQWQALMAISVK